MSARMLEKSHCTFGTEVQMSSTAMILRPLLLRQGKAAYQPINIHSQLHR
jgi:hypothetical protein